MLHPIYFLPTLYTDTDMSIFGMVIVLAFQICILLMGFTASFSKGTQQYESWHEFPIDLLYKEVSSLDTKWRILASCPNSQYIGTHSSLWLTQILQLSRNALTTNLMHVTAI